MTTNGTLKQLAIKVDMAAALYEVYREELANAMEMVRTAGDECRKLYISILEYKRKISETAGVAKDRDELLMKLGDILTTLRGVRADDDKMDNVQEWMQPLIRELLSSLRERDKSGDVEAKQEPAAIAGTVPIAKETA